MIAKAKICISIGDKNSGVGKLGRGKLGLGKVGLHWNSQYLTIKHKLKHFINASLCGV